MKDDALVFLGLIRRAGKLVTGEENTASAARRRRAKLILLASDASPNAEKRAFQFAATAGCSVVRLEADKAKLAHAVGTSPFAIAAVCDSGFAGALEQRL